MLETQGEHCLYCHVLTLSVQVNISLMPSLVHSSDSVVKRTEKFVYLNGNVSRSEVCTWWWKCLKTSVHSVFHLSVMVKHVSVVYPCFLLLREPDRGLTLPLNKIKVYCCMIYCIH